MTIAYKLRCCCILVVLTTVSPIELAIFIMTAKTAEATFVALLDVGVGRPGH